MSARRTTAQIVSDLGLKTTKSLVAARAVRTPDGRWWEACRECGLRDDEAPTRWVEPLITMTRDDAAELEAEPGRRACGRGWALDYIDEIVVHCAPVVKRRPRSRR